MNNIYYNKYLKYKTKYFKLKNNSSVKTSFNIPRNESLNIFNSTLVGGMEPEEKSKSNKISGPISCTRHRFDDGEYIKDIYIFGDVHQIINPCKEEEGKSIEFQEYLGELFSNSQKLIDFFIETPMKQKVFKDHLNPKPENFINKIESKFQDCFFQKDCPYLKVRFHYTDPRDTDLLEIPYHKIVKILGADFVHPEDLPKISEYIKKVDELTQKEKDNFYYQKSDVIYDVCINEIFPMINEIIKSGIGFKYLYYKYVELLEKSNLLKKEIDKAGRYSTNIKNYSRKLIYQIINEDYYIIRTFYYNFFAYKDNKETFKIIIGTNYLNILQMIDDIVYIVISISSVLMDSYVLSRVLKDEFNMDESSKKYKLNYEKYGEEHIYIKNIIIYAGESHCNNYREFLDENYFNRENIAIHTEGEYNQCMELDSPLFD